MAPRRNPDIVVAILWENGNWGANSAKLGAQIINAFVEKQRRRAGNLRVVAASPAPASIPPPTPGTPATSAHPKTASAAAAPPAAE